MKDTITGIVFYTPQKLKTLMEYLNLHLLIFRSILLSYIHTIPVIEQPGRQYQEIRCRMARYDGDILINK